MVDEINDEILEKTNAVQPDETENDILSDSLLDENSPENDVSDIQEDALFEPRRPSAGREENDEGLLENESPFALEDETVNDSIVLPPRVPQNPFSENDALKTEEEQTPEEENLIQEEENSEETALSSDKISEEKADASTNEQETVEQNLKEDSPIGHTEETLRTTDETEEGGENVPETPFMAGPPKSHNFVQNTDLSEENSSGSEENAEDIVTPREEESVQAVENKEMPEETKEENKEKDEKGPAPGRARGFFREAAKRVVIRPANQDANLPPPPSFKNDVKKVLKYFFFIPMVILLLIAGGIFGTVFFISPYFIRSFLDSKGLTGVTYTVESKGLTEMTLANVKDTEGNFEIGKIILKYDLLDFFKKRIRIMSVENLNLTMMDGENSFSFSNFPTFLKLVAGSSDLEVDSIQIRNSNAVLLSDGKEIPLEFSANGYFKSGLRFSIPFKFQDKGVTVEKGTLSISQQGNDTVFDLSIDKADYKPKEGETLPILGTAKIIFQPEAVLKSANISLSFSEDKKLEAIVKESSRNPGYYDMEAKWTENFFEPYFFKRDFQNVLSLSLGDIKFHNNYKSFTSYTSLKANLQNILVGETFIHQAQAVALGSLSCSYGEGCTYKLMPKTALKLAMTGVYSSLNGNTFYITKPIVTEIKRTRDEYLFSFKPDKTDISIQFPALSFQGIKYWNSLEMPFYFSAKNFSYKYKGADKDFSLDLSSPQLNLITADFSMGDAILDLRFSHGQLKKMTLKSYRVELADKSVFDKLLYAGLTITDKNEILARIFPLDTPLNINASGVISPDYTRASMNFSTNVLTFTPEFQPSKVFSLFKDLKGTVSGSAAASGVVTILPNKLQVERVSLSPSNLSFPLEEWEFNSVEGDANFTSLFPPVSFPDQIIRMKSLSTPILNLENVRMNYTLEGDKKLIKLKNISFSVRGAPTYLEDISLSYLFTGAPYVFPFYNVERLLQEYFAPKNLFIQGKLSANMTLQMKNGVAEMVKTELIPTSPVTLRYTGEPTNYITAYQADALKNYSLEGAEVLPDETGKEFIIRLTGSQVKEGGVPEKKELLFRYPISFLADFFKKKE